MKHFFKYFLRKSSWTRMWQNILWYKSVKNERYFTYCSHWYSLLFIETEHCVMCLNSGDRHMLENPSKVWFRTAVNWWDETLFFTSEKKLPCHICWLCRKHGNFKWKFYRCKYFDVWCSILSKLIYDFLMFDIWFYFPVFDYQRLHTMIRILDKCSKVHILLCFCLRIYLLITCICLVRVIIFTW